MPGVDPDGRPLQAAALVVQRLARLRFQRAAGHQAAGVAQGAAAQLEVAARVAPLVWLDAGFDHPGVVDMRRLQRDAFARRQALPVDQFLRAADLGAATGVGLAVQLHGLGRDLQVALAGGLGQAQLAAGVDADVAAAGGHVAGQPHPHALLGADQADRPGVHPAQRRAVDRQLRLLAAIGGARRGLQAVGLDVVAAGDDVEVLRVELGVELGAAGDQVELFEVADVQFGAFDDDVAAVHLEALQALAVHDRLAGGEGRARRVDEAAALAGDAVRVGDDHPRRLPGHLGVAGQGAAVAAGDLVEDHLRRLALEVGVAEDDPAELGTLGLAGGVVEDQPVGADVVVAEMVVRQPGAVGRGDIDDGHAVARLAQAGVAAGGLVQRQPRRRGDDRVEEQDAGQGQGDALVQRAADVHIVTPWRVGARRG